MINPMCPLCQRASETRFGGFDEACRGCMARRAARSPQFWRCSKEGRLSAECRRLLMALDVTHEDARQAAADDWKPAAERLL